MNMIKAPLALCVAGTLMALSVQVSAKTPDGRTPAEETVCDQYSGALFGLCNAICEAQDLDQYPKDPTDDVLYGNFEKKGGDDLLCRGQIPE